MIAKETYAVDVFRLKPGTHEFKFDITDALFSNFSESPVERASGTVALELIKQESLIRAILDFDVETPLTCDRSLKEFSYPVKEQHEILFKYGEEEQEIDDDVYIITRNTQRIDFAQFLYEFIILSIPMKKIHPDLQADEEEEDEVIFTSEAGNSDEGGNDDNDIDPRWEMLKKLK